MRILLTGFEPFGGRDRNLSWDVAAKAASCDSFKDWVNAVRLPVSFRKVTEIVSGLLQYMKPDVHEAGRYAHARYGCQKGKNLGRETGRQPAGRTDTGQRRIPAC